MFKGETITGPKGGHIAVVSDFDNAFEIHALGDVANREFYLKKAALDLATGHAAILNARGHCNDLHSSFIRRL